MTSRNALHKTFQVLLVEDDQSDTELVTQALQDTHVRHDLHTVADGIEAVQFVRREEPHRRAPRPDLVLLDLALPRSSGHDVLQTLKSDPDLRGIPAVILSGSREERDIWQSYHLHANAYVVKPSRGEDFLVAVRRLAEFYFLHNELAPPERPLSV